MTYFFLSPQWALWSYKCLIKRVYFNFTLYLGRVVAFDGVGRGHGDLSLKEYIALVRFFPLLLYLLTVAYISLITTPCIFNSKLYTGWPVKHVRLLKHQRRLKRNLSDLSLNQPRALGSKVQKKDCQINVSNTTKNYKDNSWKWNINVKKYYLTRN